MAPASVTSVTRARTLQDRVSLIGSSGSITQNRNEEPVAVIRICSCYFAEFLMRPDIDPKNLTKYDVLCSDRFPHPNAFGGWVEAADYDGYRHTDTDGKVSLFIATSRGDLSHDWLDVTDYMTHLNFIGRNDIPDWGPLTSRPYSFSRTCLIISRWSHEASLLRQRPQQNSRRPIRTA
jgi:hypothetical protein